MEALLMDLVRDAWRKLGFFHEWIQERSEWRIVGSRSGLNRLVEILRTRANEPANDAIGSFVYLGPHSNFLMTTSTRRGIDSSGLRGQRSDFLLLAEIAQRVIAALRSGDHGIIGKEFAGAASGTLRIELQSDDFDPSSLDQVRGSKGRLSGFVADLQRAVGRIVSLPRQEFETRWSRALSTALDADWLLQTSAFNIDTRVLKNVCDEFQPWELLKHAEIQECFFRWRDAPGFGRHLIGTTCEMHRHGIVLIEDVFLTPRFGMGCRFRNADGEVFSVETFD